LNDRGDPGVGIIQKHRRDAPAISHGLRFDADRYSLEPLQPEDAEAVRVYGHQRFWGRQMTTGNRIYLMRIVEESSIQNHSELIV